VSSASPKRYFRAIFFARFALSELLLRVRTACGVSSIVQFGNRYPVLPDCVVEQLREAIGNARVELVPTLHPGGNVRLVSGAFAGLYAVIIQVLPAKERVKLLLELLGRETIVEVASMDVLPDRQYSNIHLPKLLDERQRASETR
jgi:transcriptional antiterminator RfaH